MNDFGLGEHVGALLYVLAGLMSLIAIGITVIWKMLNFIWRGQQTQITHCLTSIKDDVEAIVKETKECQLHLTDRFADKPTTEAKLSRLFERQDSLRDRLPVEFMARRDLENTFRDLKEQIKECHTRMGEIQSGIDWLKRANGKDR